MSALSSQDTKNVDIHTQGHKREKTSHTASKETKNDQATNVDKHTFVSLAEWCCGDQRVTNIDTQGLKRQKTSPSQETKSEEATKKGVIKGPPISTHTPSQETKSEPATNVQQTQSEPATNVESDDESQASRKTLKWDPEGKYDGIGWDRMVMGLDPDDDSLDHIILSQDHGVIKG